MKEPLRIISWNVAGIKARQPDLNRLIEKYSPDIICLQKTKTADVPKLNGYGSFSSCDDRWSGVSIYCRIDMKFDVIESDSHHQIIDCGSFRLINAYVPYSNARLTASIQLRKEWDRWLYDYIISLEKPVIICGDLNIVHTDIDTFILLVSKTPVVTIVGNETTSINCLQTEAKSIPSETSIMMSEPIHILTPGTV